VQLQGSGTTLWSPTNWSAVLESIHGTRRFCHGGVTLGNRRTIARGLHPIVVDFLVS
jgi:hypothetical protein